MQQDIKIFTLIVKNSIFAFLKEAYADEVFDDKDNENINKINDMLRQLEKYAHLPDKKKIIKESYVSIKHHMQNHIFKEESFLLYLKEETLQLNKTDKTYILNSVIYVIKNDNDISSTEKEIIMQISRFLGIDMSYVDILKTYNRSSFGKPINSKYIFGVVILIVLVIFGSLFYKISEKNNVVLFDTASYQFDEIYFNRYIVYKNLFAIKSEKFEKFAIYNIAGTAIVSFNPENLHYDFLSQTVTLEQDKFYIKLHVKQSKKQEIDKVNPKSITKGEIQLVSAGVAMAGAYTGASVGSNFGKIGGAVGGIFGGAAGYFATSKIMSGTKFSSNISESNKKETLREGEKLILKQLQEDEGLAKMYKQHFEAFIKAKYNSFNLKVLHIKYKKLESGEGNV